MPNTAEQAIYNRLASAPTFHPASAKLLPTDWTLEPGDVVTVKSGETSYSVPVYSMDLTWNANSQNGTCESATTRISVESTGGQTREPLPELQRKQFEQDRNAYTNFKAQKQEIDEHWQHVVEVTDQGMEDCFGVIGVKLDAQHKPIKDAQGNYVWAGPNDSPAEIWGHLHRNAWTHVIQNHIQDEHGNILSIGQVLTSADGQALITAINDQRTGTATINANRIKLQATDSITLDAVMGIEANTSHLRVIGDLYVDDVIWTTDISALSSIHSDITIDAPTIEGGYGRFANLYCKSAEDQYGELTGGIDVSTAYNAFQFVVDPNNSGHFILQGKTLSDQTNWANAANFNIAATAYFQNAVAAARNVSSISGVSLSTSDLGHATNHSVTVTNNDGSTASASIDIYAPSGGSSSITAQNINLANSYDIFEVAADATSYDGNNLVYLANLSAAISQSRTGAVAFRATIDDVSGAGYKYYKVKRL